MPIIILCLIIFFILLIFYQLFLAHPLNNIFKRIIIEGKKNMNAKKSAGKSAAKAINKAPKAAKAINKAPKAAKAAKKSKRKQTNFTKEEKKIPVPVINDRYPSASAPSQDIVATQLLNAKNIVQSHSNAQYDKYASIK